MNRIATLLDTWPGVVLLNRIATLLDTWLRQNHIQNVANEIQVFKKTLKRFLLYNPFYYIAEYFNANK